MILSAIFPSLSPNFSLVKQILLIASMMLLIFFLSASLILTQVFKVTLEQGAREELQAHLYALLSAAEFDQTLYLPQQLPEERFNQLESDLYGWVVDEEQENVWQSSSFLHIDLLKPHILFEKMVVSLNEQTKSIGEFYWESDQFAVFVLSLTVQWEMNDGRFSIYTFNVAQDRQAFEEQLVMFRNRLWFSFSVLSLLLLVMQWILLQRGFLPLKKLQLELETVDSGRACALQADYPLEIRPVVESFNRVVLKERSQRQRYQNTLADLAHSLKTPLTVLKTITVQPDQQSIFEAQVQRMDRMIHYQLHRSVVSQSQVHSHCLRTPLLPIVTEVGEALQKVELVRSSELSHSMRQGQQVSLQIQVLSNFQVPLSEADAYEVMGCLLDNAFKHCRYRVLVEASVTAEGFWQVSISDDGKGLSVAQQQQVLRRGVRFDETFNGQGLGLHIVQDIIASYRLYLTIGTHSSLGGALFVLSNHSLTL